LKCCQPDSAAVLSVVHSQLMPSWLGMRAALSCFVQGPSAALQSNAALMVPAGASVVYLRVVGSEGVIPVHIGERCCCHAPVCVALLACFASLPARWMVGCKNSNGKWQLILLQCVHAHPQQQKCSQVTCRCRIPLYPATETCF
jgi:hypothetical protein